MNKETFLLFHKDHPLYVQGVNSGAEMATRNLAKFLAQAGHEVVVCAQLPEGEGSWNGIEFWDLGDEFDVGRALTRARDLDPYHLISAGRALPVMQSKTEENCLSRTLICHDPSGTATGIRNDILCKVADGVICVSEAQKEMFVQAGADPKKVHVIRNGVDLELFQPGDNKVRDPFKLIFVGALVPHKGAHMAINAFLELKKKFPSLTLDLYGSADLWGERNYLDPRAIEFTIPGVKFYGKTKQEVIVEALKRAGIALSPSIWFEALGLASLEAQATGCPVVAFDVGGLKETMIDGQTGILVKEISAPALAAAVAKLLSDPKQILAMGAKAAETVRSRFSWEKVAANVILLCQGYVAGTKNTATDQSKPWMLLRG